MTRHKHNQKGHIQFQDPPKPPEMHKPVQNLLDPDARTPLAAHVEYWVLPLAILVYRRKWDSASSYRRFWGRSRTLIALHALQIQQSRLVPQMRK